MAFLAFGIDEWASHEIKDDWYTTIHNIQYIKPSYPE